MYTKEQLQDAVICATRSIAKLYDSREELEKAVNELDHAPEMKDMKTIQSVVRSKFPTVNGGVVAKLFKDLISK